MTFCFRVDRGYGLFGNTTLTWRTYNSKGKVLEDGEEISVVSGHLAFDEGVENALIQFHVLKDEVPELNETLIVKLEHLQGWLFI